MMLFCGVGRSLNPHNLYRDHCTNEDSTVIRIMKIMLKIQCLAEGIDMHDQSLNIYQ